MDLLIPKIVLLLLSAWGWWTLWGFPYTNGLLKILSDLSLPGASIPGPTYAPMKQRYTGIKFIDQQLIPLTAFFYTAVDGNRADVSLIGLDFGSSVVAAWMLMTVESMRLGNQGKWWITSYVIPIISPLGNFVSSISPRNFRRTIFGLLLQKIGFGCIAPIWMFLHLSTSPTTVTNPKPFTISPQEPIQLAIAPIAVMLGYGIPSVAMCLPAPAKISFETKQAWAAAQQFWPVWVAIAQITLNILVNVLNTTVNAVSESTKQEQTKRYLRLNYRFAIISALSGHVVSIGLSALAYAFPVLFSSTYLPQLQPERIYRPIWPFTYPPSHGYAKTLADGALWFLQWDFYTSVPAVVVWALTLHTAAKRQTASPLQIVIGSIKLVLIAAALGPVGLAVVAVWGRDNLVFAQESAGTGTAGRTAGSSAGRSGVGGDVASLVGRRDGSWKKSQ